MKTRRNKKIMIVAAVIIVFVMLMMSVIIHIFTVNVFCIGVGTVTEKEQKGNEYFTTVILEAPEKTLEKTFKGKGIYDSFEEQDEVKVVYFSKQVFGFYYDAEIQGLMESKK